ncbi:hypothetical protein PG988_003409 [Apiospora saccharicola]
MTSFIDLPREIRDDILHRTLLSERSAPAKGEDGVDRTPITDIKVKCSLFKDRVLYEKQTTQPTATTLMLANRQLRKETQDALKRLPDQGMRCKVDIMFLEERELWVTFTHVPLCSTTLDQVDVTIRLVGTMRGFGAGFSREETHRLPHGREAPGAQPRVARRPKPPGGPRRTDVVAPRAEARRRGPDARHDPSRVGGGARGGPVPSEAGAARVARALPRGLSAPHDR